MEGVGYRLRPVAMADAGFILELRSDPLLGRLLHTTSTRLVDQERWLQQYFDREGDYYFVIESRRGRVAQGVVGIYDVHAETRLAEWGRWILKAGSLAAVESAWLVYQCAFEMLQLDAVYCRTNAENTAVISFHDSCGIPRHQTLVDHFTIAGHRVDAVEHRIRRTQWPTVAQRLERLSTMTARRLAHD